MLSQGYVFCGAGKRSQRYSLLVEANEPEAELRFSLLVSHVELVHVEREASNTLHCAYLFFLSC